jgi:hypothetical protein
MRGPAAWRLLLAVTGIQISTCSRACKARFASFHNISRHTPRNTSPPFPALRQVECSPGIRVVCRTRSRSLSAVRNGPYAMVHKESSLRNDRYAMIRTK